MEIVEIEKTPKKWVLYLTIWVFAIVSQFFCEPEEYIETDNYCLSFSAKMPKGII